MRKKKNNWREWENEAQMVDKLKKITIKKLGRNQCKYSKKKDGGLSITRGRVSFK